MLQWLKLDTGPELPPSIETPPDGLDGSWWGAVANDLSSLYLFVCGDGGTVPLSITIYVMAPELLVIEKDDPPWEARWPTLPELWGIADRFALDGALLMPCGPLGTNAIACAGSEALENVYVPGECSAFQMMQGAAMPDSAAQRRMLLSGLGANLVIGGQPNG